VTEIGRVVGKSVGEVAFRVRHDCDLRIGEVLKVTGSQSDKPLFVRVVDVLHGADALEAQWAERTAGLMMELERDGAPFTFADKERRLYKVGLAAPLGWWDGTRFRKPKGIPDHFATVATCEEADFRFLSAYAGDLTVGLLRSGDHTLQVPVGVAGRLLPYHIGVFATTGMGKSNLMKVLAASLMESGRYGLLLLDPHGEFYDGGSGALPDGRPLRGLKHHPLAADRLEVYSSRPLSGRHHDITLSAYEIHPHDVRNIYTFSPPQNEALEAVWSQQREKWLVYLAQEDEKTIIADLGGGSRFYEGTIGVLKRRAERILGWSEFVHRDPKVSTTKRITSDLHAGRIVLVDTSSLWEDQELLISACLARRLLNENKALYRNREAFDRTPPVLITLEEALKRATNPNEFKLKIQGIQSTADISREEMDAELEIPSDFNPMEEESPFDFSRQPPTGR
jgi:hypothetical protein